MIHCHYNNILSHSSLFLSKVRIVYIDNISIHIRVAYIDINVIIKIQIVYIDNIIIHVRIAYIDNIILYMRQSHASAVCDVRMS